MKKATRAVLMVGSASDCADIEYATGFRAPDPVVCVSQGSQRYLVVSSLELGRARGLGTAEVFTPQMLTRGRMRQRRLGYWAVCLLRRLGIKRVTVSHSLPLGVARLLEQEGLQLTVERGELFPERQVKSAAEIRRIAEAQQAAVMAMRAATALIASAGIDADGFLKVRGRRLSSQDVQRLITQRLVEHNCFVRDVIVAGGRQGADPHERGEGLLRARESIVIDIFPQHLGHGYWGDLTRTVLRGEAPARLRKMYAAVRAAQTAALGRIRAGVACATVHRAACAELERRGFKTEVRDGKAIGFIHGTGHGVGLAIHEAPSLGSGPGRLKAGNVVTVEPGYYDPELGGIRIEDTVLVTRTGWAYLAPCEKRFEL